MKHLIFTIAMVFSCFPCAIGNNTSGTAQATASGTQADVDELDDVVDAANLLIYFKAYVNGYSEITEESEFGDFLWGYEGPKDYAFEETRSAETVWYRNCTLKKNSPLPQTYAKGTTSIVSLEASMGGGLTVYLSVFNKIAASQIKRQLERLDVKVSDNYDDPEADVNLVYDQSSKRWVMSCNSFAEFITRDAENPQPYLCAKLLPSLLNYTYYKSEKGNYFQGLGFKMLKDDGESLISVYGHNTKYNNVDDFMNFDRWFTSNNQSAIGIIDSHNEGYLTSFIFYNKQLFDEMKAKAIDMGFKLYPESEPGSESYMKGGDFITFNQKPGHYQVSIILDSGTDE